MRYWSTAYPNLNDIDVVETFSEDEIIEQYYPWWSDQMKKKYGEVYFEEIYCKKDCIDDWIVINWAWEST